MKNKVITDEEIKKLLDEEYQDKLIDLKKIYYSMKPQQRLFVFAELCADTCNQCGKKIDKKECGCV